MCTLGFELLALMITSAPLCVAQVGLEFMIPPTSASRFLVLQTCTVIHVTGFTNIHGLLIAQKELGEFHV